MRYFRFITIFTFLVLSCKSWSALEFEDAVFPEMVVSGRALGMGNAFIAKSDDAAAAFYNPAGLGSIRTTHLHLSNFHFEANKGWLDVGTGGSLSDAFSNFGKSFDLNGLRELLLENKGKMAHSRFSFMPNFTTRYFSAGYFLHKQTRATIGKEPGAQFEYADRLDHGPYAALNVSLFGGVLKFGATGMFVARKELIGEADPNTEFNPGSSDEYKGGAFLVTTGAKLTIPFMFLPTFAATIHNTLDSDFSASSGSAGAPTKVQRTMNVGFSLTPVLTKISRCHFEVNYKDLSGRYPNVSGQRKTTVGMEVDFYRAMFVRLGLGDGYGSAGLGLKTQTFELDLSTYAVDTTSSEFRGEEDRRFSLTFSSGF